ncbi:hypothetical protein P460_01142 [Mycobacterium tuberculosis TKK_02_0069]|nr:hypothetical protein P460_01142 [Mycobacterium tuberculosis TKK_02_0069]SGC72040.1 Conserved membrane protein of uncharacterised function [Mycobacterium tuberculosis]SGD02845.1 Conserved membrane protein of uncharacterised function [Mycobacterium tuberculosis]SGG58337.1 Conserved membrane protein of uncharacterised function [Mycobacterium tuberculosis]
MPGLGQIALNSAPIFGGAMLAIAAGQFKGPDFRALIRQDMDLLDRLPADATKRRANLQRTIDARIDDLIDAADKSHALRKAAMSYRGNWRDIVLLVCVLLFTIIWWNVNHGRANWLNRPGMSGDSSSWKGWGHVRWFIEEVPAGAA